MPPMIVVGRPVVIKSNQRSRAIVQLQYIWNPISANVRKKRFSNHESLLCPQQGV